MTQHTQLKQHRIEVDATSLHITLSQILYNVEARGDH